jgi:hypothetical protein
LARVWQRFMPSACAAQASASFSMRMR